jgi:hypothetical protein
MTMVATPAPGDLGVQDRGAMPAISPEPEREAVHLLHTSGRPPPGGGMCQCIAAGCGATFHSRSATWTIDRTKHDSNAFTGRFKSCNAYKD